MNQLRFQLQKRSYPYSKKGNLETWGTISIYVVDSLSNKTILLEGQWDLANVQKWFSSYRDQLCNEPFAPYLASDESFWNGLIRLRDKEFGNEEEQGQWHDVFYHFYQIHNLRAVLEGADIYKMLIGCQDGIGIIAADIPENIYSTGNPNWYQKPGNWEYRFDMIDFINDLYIVLSVL